MSLSIFSYVQGPCWFLLLNCLFRSFVIFFFFNLVVFFLFISENYILGNLVLYNECQIFSPHFVPLGLFLRNIPLAYLQGKDSADRLENPKMVL